MFKVNRLTGYSVMILSSMIKKSEGKTDFLIAASEISNQTNLPLATVIKILKQLNSAKLVKSQRGAKGGYFITEDTLEASFADLIEAIEGPIRISDCESGKKCYIKEACPILPFCPAINTEIRAALDKVKIKDMASKAK